MLEVLKLFNYTPPNIKIIEDNRYGPTGPIRAFEIREYDDVYILYIKGQQWMMYNKKNHTQAAQVFSHYYLAEGDVITTGLGFGARELWLLNNPKVKSLTILEKNEDVINYNKKVNPILFDKANIVNCDASNYKSKCDTLLLDHYEFEPINYIINNVKNICKNIECNKLWFWYLESLILSELHKVPNDNLFTEFREGRFKIDVQNLMYIKEVYEYIKNTNDLYKLPDLTDEELKLILSISTSFFQII